MTKVITYGTFDLLHQGHINILKRAKELGDYLIVGVTSDHFDLERGKMNTIDNLMDRIEAVKRTGFADKIIVEEYQGQKIDDIQNYEVDIFAIGSDWEGKFDYLNEYCQVRYLPRTEGISSTKLREDKLNLRIGVIGTGSIAYRFVQEAQYVSGNTISIVYNTSISLAKDFCEKLNIKEYAKDLDEFLTKCDAVYIASPHYTHYYYAKRALESLKHVLCETPFVSSLEQAEELYALAKLNNLNLMVAHKTAYCPSFLHLISLLKSGVIGEIVDVNASITTLTDEKSDKLNSKLFGGSMIENSFFPLLPIFKLMGLNYENINFYSKMKNDVDIYTKGVIKYERSIASFQVGLGVKSEGNMVISGTRAYVYVPAPWWKTDFFEIRFEDINKNKKYFYPFEGEGLRYEIKDFISTIYSNKRRYLKLSKEETLAMVKVQEAYIKKENTYIL